MNQAELWKKVDLLREKKKSLKAELLLMKDELPEMMAHEPLFMAGVKCHIDKMLEDLNSYFF